MKYVLITMVSLFYVLGCSPKDAPRAIIPPPPKQTESALPSVKKASDEVVKTIDNNTKIGTKISESKQTVLDQKVSILEALSQAEKIKEKALAKVAISELEALNLIMELKKVESRNLFLETQNNELSELKIEQEKILNIIKNTLAETEKKVIFKEDEAHLLREQNVYLSDHLVAKNDEADNLKKLLAREKEVSASAKTYRNIIWMIAGTWLLLLIIKNVLMSLNPTARFRF